MGNSPGQLRLELGDLPGKSRQGHGSRACYIAGCREARCMAANTRYQRNYRQYLNGTRPPARLPRGTIPDGDT